MLLVLPLLPNKSTTAVFTLSKAPLLLPTPPSLVTNPRWWFTRSTYNDKHHFITHAGTTFALLALGECNELAALKE